MDMKRINFHKVLGLLMFAGLTYFGQGMPMSSITPNFPLRIQFIHNDGYPGEMALQQAALTHGVWVGQQMARDLGGRSQLLLADNLEVALTKLGFEFETWDYAQHPPSQANLQSYIVWIKQQLIAGRIVIFPARFRPDDPSEVMDAEYNHIMPMFGIHYNSATAGMYDANDRLIWADNYGHMTNKSLKEYGVFAAYQKCETEDFFGCIPKGPSTNNYATAIIGLPDANKLYLPMQLNILGWERRACNATREMRAKNATAVYSLTIPPGTIPDGSKFTIFKCEGPGSVPANATNISQLSSAPGCKGFPFVWDATTPAQLTEKGLGPLKAYSATYFVAVLNKEQAVASLG